MNTTLLLEWVIKSAVILAFLLVGFAYLTLFERRVLARMQVRIGPNRAGPWGLLQPVADGLKLIFKEELIPDKADKLIFVTEIAGTTKLVGVIGWPLDRRCGCRREPLSVGRRGWRFQLGVQRDLATGGP